MYGRVVVIKRSGHVGGRYVVTTSQCYMGSNKNCDIRISIPYVAERHCIIKAQQNKQAIIKNLSKTHSTFVNGEPITERTLEHLDVITICGRHFRWEYPAGSQFYRWIDHSENMSAMVEVPVNIFKKRRRSESAILKAKPKKLIAVVSPLPRNNPTENVADAGSVSERGNSVGFSRFTVVNKKVSTGKGRKTLHNFNFPENTQKPTNERVKAVANKMLLKMSLGVLRRKSVANASRRSSIRPHISTPESTQKKWSMQSVQSMNKTTSKKRTADKNNSTERSKITKKQKLSLSPNKLISSVNKNRRKSVTRATPAVERNSRKLFPERMPLQQEEGTPKRGSPSKKSQPYKTPSPGKASPLKSLIHSVNNGKKSVKKAAQKVGRTSLTPKTPIPVKSPAYNIKSGKKSARKATPKVGRKSMSLIFKTPSPRKSTLIKSPVYNVNSGRNSVKKATPKIKTPSKIYLNLKTPSPRKGSPATKSPTFNIKSGKKSIGKATPKTGTPSKISLTSKTPRSRAVSPGISNTYGEKNKRKSREKSPQNIGMSSRKSQTPKIRSPFVKSPTFSVRSARKSVGKATPTIRRIPSISFTPKTPSIMEESSHNINSRKRTVEVETPIIGSPSKVFITKTLSPEKSTPVKFPTYNIQSGKKSVRKSASKVGLLTKTTLIPNTPSPRKETSPMLNMKSAEKSVEKSTQKVGSPTKATLTLKTPSPRKQTLQSPTKRTVTPTTPSPWKETPEKSRVYVIKSGKKSVGKSTPKLGSPSAVYLPKTPSPRKGTPVKTPTYNIKSGKKSLGKQIPKIRSPTMVTCTPKIPSPWKQSPVKSPTKIKIQNGKKSLGKSTPKVGSPSTLSLPKTPSPKKVTPVWSPTYNLKSGKKSVEKQTPKVASPVKATLSPKTPSPRRQTPVKSSTHNVKSGKKSIGKSTTKVGSPSTVSLPKKPSPKKVTPVRSPTYNIKSGKKSVEKQTPKVASPVKATLSPKTPSPRRQTPVKSPTYNVKSGKKSIGKSTTKVGSPSTVSLPKTPSPKKVTPVRSPTYNIKSGKKSVEKQAPKVASPVKATLSPKTPSPRRQTTVKSPTYNTKSGKKSIAKSTPKVGSPSTLSLPKTPSSKKVTPVRSPTYNIKSGNKTVEKQAPKVASPVKATLSPKTPSPRRQTPVKSPTYNVKSGKKSIGKSTPKVGSPSTLSLPKTPSPKKVTPVRSPTSNIKSGKKSVEKQSPKVTSPAKAILSPKTPSPRRQTPVKSPTYNTKSGKKSIAKSTPKVGSPSTLSLPKTPSSKKVTPVRSPTYNIKSGNKTVEKQTSKVASPVKATLSPKTPSPRRQTPVKSPTYNTKSGKKSIAKSTPKVGSPSTLSLPKTPSPKKVTPVRSPTYNIKSGNKTVEKQTPKVASPAKATLSPKTPSPRRQTPVKSPTYNVKSGKKSIGKSTPKVGSPSTLSLPKTPSPKKVTPVRSPTSNIKSGKKSVEKQSPKVASPAKAILSPKTPSPRRQTPVKSPTYNTRSGKKSIGKSTPKVGPPSTVSLPKTPSPKRVTPMRYPTYNIKSGKKSIGKSTPKVGSPSTVSLPQTPSPKKVTPVRSPTSNIKSGKKSVKKQSPKVASPAKAILSPKTPSPRRQTPVKSPTYNTKSGKKSIAKSTPKVGSPSTLSLPKTPSPKKVTPGRSPTYNIKSGKKSVGKPTRNLRLPAKVSPTSKIPSPSKQTPVHVVGQVTPVVGRKSETSYIPNLPSSTNTTVGKFSRDGGQKSGYVSPSKMGRITGTSLTPKTPILRSSTLTISPTYNVRSAKKSVIYFEKKTPKIEKQSRVSFILMTPSSKEDSPAYVIKSGQKLDGETSPRVTQLAGASSTPKTRSSTKGSTLLRFPAYKTKSGKKSFVKATAKVETPVRESLGKSASSIGDGLKSILLATPDGSRFESKKEMVLTENVASKSYKILDFQKASSVEKESVKSRGVKSDKKSVMIATPDTGINPRVSLYRKTPFRNIQSPASENDSSKISANRSTRSSSGLSSTGVSLSATRGKRKRESSSDQIQSIKKPRSDTSEITKKTSHVDKSVTTLKKKTSTKSVASAKKHGRRVQSAKKLTTETPRSYKKKMAALLVLHAKGKFNMAKKKPLYSDIVKSRAPPPKKTTTSVSAVPLRDCGVQKPVSKRTDAVSVAPLRLNANSTGHVNSPETIIIGRKTKPRSLPKTRKGRKSVQPVVSKIQRANKSFDGFAEIFKTPHQEVQQNKSAKSSPTHRQSSARVRFSTAKYMSPVVSVRSLDLVNMSGIKTIKTPPSVLKKSSRLYFRTPFLKVVATRLAESPESPLAKELNSSFPNSVKTPQSNRKTSVETSFSKTIGNDNQEIASVVSDSTPKSTTKLKPFSSCKKTGAISPQDSNTSHKSGRQTRNFSLLSTSVASRKISAQDTTLGSFSPLSIISGNRFTSITSGKKSLSENPLRVIFSDHDVSSSSSAVFDKRLSSVNKRKRKSLCSKTSATAESLESFITDGTSQESVGKRRSISSENLYKSNLSIHNSADPQKLSISTFVTSPGVGSIEVEALKSSSNLSVTKQENKSESSKRLSHPSVTLDLRNLVHKTRSSGGSDFTSNSKLLTPDQMVAAIGSLGSLNRKSKNRFAVSTPKSTITHRRSRKISSLSNSGASESQIDQNAFGSGRKLRNSSSAKTPSEEADLREIWVNSVSNYIHQTLQEESSNRKRKSTGRQKLLDTSGSSSKHENTALSSDSTEFDFNAVATPIVPKELFVSPISLALKRQSVKNDLSDVQGVKRMFPLANSPASLYKNLKGIKRSVRIPVKSPGPVGITGIKRLFVTSPRCDYTDVKGVKRLLTTPKSPQIEYTNVEGIKKLFDRNTPASDYTDVIGIKQIYRKRSPKSSYLDVTGVRRIFKEDKSPQSPMLVGVECLFESPKSVSVDKLVQEPSTSGEKRSTPQVGGRSLRKRDTFKKSISPIVKGRKISYIVSNVPVQEDSRRPTRSRQANVKEIEFVFESPKSVAADKFVQEPSVWREKRDAPEVKRSVRKMQPLKKIVSVPTSPAAKKSKAIRGVIQDSVQENVNRRQTRTRQAYVENVEAGKENEETKTEVPSQNGHMDKDIVARKGKKGKKPVKHTSEADNIGEKQKKTDREEHSENMFSVKKKDRRLAPENNIAEPASGERILRRARNQLSPKDQEIIDLKSQASNRTRSHKRVANTVSKEADESTTVLSSIKRRKVESISTAELIPEKVSNKRSVRKRGGDTSEKKSNKVEETVISKNVYTETKSKGDTGIQTRKTRNKVSSSVSSETDIVLSVKKITVEDVESIIKKNQKQTVKVIEKTKEASGTLSEIQLEATDDKDIKVTRKTRTATEKEKSASSDGMKRITRKSMSEANEKPDNLFSGRRRNAKRIDEDANRLSGKVSIEVPKAKMDQSDVESQKSKENVDNLFSGRRRNAKRIDEDANRLSGKVSIEVPKAKKDHSDVKSQKSKENVEKKESLVLKKRTRNQLSEIGNKNKNVSTTQKQLNDAGETEKIVSPKEKRNTRQKLKNTDTVLHKGADIKVSPKITKTRSKVVLEDTAKSIKRSKEIDDKHDNIINIGSTRTRGKLQTGNTDSASAKHAVMTEIIVSDNDTRSKSGRSKKNLSDSTPDLTDSLKLKNSQPVISPKTKTKGKKEKNKNKKLINEIIERVQPRRNVKHAEDKISDAVRSSAQSGASQKKVQFHTVMEMRITRSKK